MTTQTFNRGFDFLALIDAMPPGLERATLRVLQYHIGRSCAIPRPVLLANVRHYIHNATDRALRLAINQLRKDGFPICSTGGIDGGYWIAANPQELDEYLDNEPKARVKDLQEQINALTTTRRKLWGEGIQPRML